MQIIHKPTFQVKKIKQLFIVPIVFLFFGHLTIMAQDAQPHKAHADDYYPNELPDEATHLSDSVPADTSTIILTHLSLPESFQHTHENKLLYPERLAPFFEKVRHRNDCKVRVLQIGDSHVRGHVLPVAVRRQLEESLGSGAMLHDSINYHTSAIATESGRNGFIFHAMGKNGATLSYWLSEERINDIVRLQPDLVIISLGTNESHGIFDPVAYTMQLDRLIFRIREACPGVDFILTTPPGSHITKYRKVRRKVRGRFRTRRVAYGRVPNNKTGLVANCISNYGSSRGYAVWNLYEIAGGDLSACENWRSAGMMARDGVHYTHKAYNIQGDLLAEAILMAYNSFIH